MTQTQQMPTLIDGVRQGLSDALQRDESVVLIGENIRAGGAFGATAGFVDRFGSDRVLDLPPCESGSIGFALGMALAGAKPIVEVQFADFLGDAYATIVSELARYRYLSANSCSCPVTIRAPFGGGIGGGPQLSANPEAAFCHAPGLTVRAPANATDAAAFISSAIDGVDPTLIFEPKSLYRSASPAVDSAVDGARIVREGEDATVISYGASVETAIAAAERAAERDIEVEVLDLRTLSPLDEDSIIASARRSGRVVILQEAARSFGVGAEIAALIAERAIEQLEAPVLRVAGWDVPNSYAHERHYRPDVERTLRAIVQVVDF